MDDVCQVDEVQIEEIGRNSLETTDTGILGMLALYFSHHTIANAFGKMVFKYCFAL